MPNYEQAFARTVPDAFGDYPSLINWIPTSLRSAIYAGTSEADVTEYVQNAINAIDRGEVLFVPRGRYNLSGAGDQLILIDKPMGLVGCGAGTRFVVADSVGASTDVFRIVAEGESGSTDYCLSNFWVQPLDVDGETIPARWGINIDVDDGPIYKSLFEKLNIGPFGSGCIKTTNTAPRTDGFFTSRFFHNYFRGLVDLTGAGDSIIFDGCTSFGDCLAYLVDLVEGCHGLEFRGCNSTAWRGFCKVLRADHMVITGGNIECVNTSASPEDAIINIVGRVGEPVLGPKINAKYVGVVTVPRAIKLDYVEDADLQNIRVDIGYGPGTPGSNEMIQMTANAKRTKVSPNVTFWPESNDARHFLDASSSTIYSQKIASTPNSSVLRDSAGALSGTSLISDLAGTLGNYQNLWLYSEDPTQSAISKSNCTITTGQTAPDGEATAVKIVEAADTAQEHGISEDPVKPASATRLYLSCYLKAAERTEARLFMYGTTTAAIAYAYFDLSSGALLLKAGSGAWATEEIEAYISDAGSGWYRCILGATSNTDAVVTAGIYTSDGSTSVLNGDGVSGLYVWGVSLSEDGISPYVPTTSARVGDFGSHEVGLFGSALTNAKHTMIGPVDIDGDVTIYKRRGNGITKLTVKAGTAQSSNQLLEILANDDSVIALLAPAGLALGQDKQIYIRDSANTTIPILGSSTADDVIRLGYASAPATNGHILFMFDSSIIARINTDGTVKAFGPLVANNAGNAIRMGSAEPTGGSHGDLYIRSGAAYNTSLYINLAGVWTPFYAGELFPSQSGATGKFLQAADDATAKQWAKVTLTSADETIVTGFTDGALVKRSGTALGSLATSGTGFLYISGGVPQATASKAILDNQNYVTHSLNQGNVCVIGSFGTLTEITDANLAAQIGSEMATELLANSGFTTGIYDAIKSAILTYVKANITVTIADGGGHGHTFTAPDTVDAVGDHTHTASVS